MILSIARNNGISNTDFTKLIIRDTGSGIALKQRSGPQSGGFSNITHSSTVQVGNYSAQSTGTGEIGIDTDAIFDLGSTRNFSYSFWYRPTSFTSDGGFRKLLYFSEAFLNAGPIMLEHRTNGYIAFGWWDGTGYIAGESSIISSDTNHFYFVELNRVDGIWNLFIDGEMGLTFNNVLNVDDNASSMQISRNASSQRYNGYIQEYKLDADGTYYTRGYTPPNREN